METLLVYIWGIYPQFGFVPLLSWIVFILGSGVLIIFMVVESALNAEERKAIEYIGFKSIIDKVFKLWVLSIVLLIVNAFTPTRNIAVMMVSAPLIVEVAKDVKDSNTTKRIGNILSDSLSILENKIKEVEGSN